MFKKHKKLKIAILVFLLMLLAAALFANYYVKKYGYRNLGHFISSYWSNKSMASDAQFETLEIKISPDDFVKLEEERNLALERGMLVKEGNTYVKAKLKHNGKKIKAELRLKGHMTDHLQDKKWSFRIKTKGGDAFMGMKVFSVQHPGTRNYIYEWIYHEMMKHEDIIALNYNFIKVKVNDEDWGIYAVEEHFAQELVNHNQRPKGPLLRFNPDMYWQARIAEHEKLSYKMDFATFNSTYLEAYDDKNTYKDSVILNGYQKAVSLMEQFRNGNLQTSDVFDIKKLAAFHAIIDVVGGHRSLDWSDVKYYYNSETNKIEPVAYESFSVQPTFSICGSSNFTIASNDGIATYHEKLFSDPIFYKEYIKQLTRIGSKKWLKFFLNSIDKNLQKKLAIVYTDYAYKDYSSEPYFKNIALIQKILDPAKGIHAYINEVKGDSMFLSITGIDALPFEIRSLTVDTTRVLPNNAAIIASKQVRGPLNYQLVKFVLPKQLSGKIAASSKLKLQYTILGQAAASKKSVDVIPVSTNDFIQSGDLNKPLTENFTNLKELVFIEQNPIKHLIKFKAGKIDLNENIIIPEGYTVVIEAGTTINFVNSARIISNSNFIATGTEENPITFLSVDETGGGITLLNAKSPSHFSYLIAHNIGNKKPVFENSAVICAYGSKVEISNSSFFENNWNDVRIVRGNLVLDNTTFGKTREDALVVYYSNASITNCNFTNIGDDGIEATGSVVRATGLNFVKIKSSAILAKCSSEVYLVNTNIKESKVGIGAKDNSQVNGNQISVTGCELAIKASQSGDVFGPSQIKIKALKQSGNTKSQEADKGSTIKIVN
jgi:hypothetical protein